ncbi:MAG: hypothetical protein GX144_01915 [Clostridiaceae bacterium]|nr:hypothetical protein [Clostridiaceae bacterium]
MNPWLFSYMVSLMLLILLIDWKQISVNLVGGTLSAVFMLADVFLGNKYGLFTFKYVGLHLPDWNLFSDRFNVFFVGLAFNIGILIMQLLPKKMEWQLIYSVIWGFFLYLFLYLANVFDLYILTKFRVGLVLRQVLFFLFLGWIKTFHLTKGRVLCKGGVHAQGNSHK